ncbi:uncharacterized protein LAESUDRAFT_767345, partial [Laetiporus sulphureus 93-53]
MSSYLRGFLTAYPDISNIYICADNRAALSLLFSLHPHPGQPFSFTFRKHLTPLMGDFPNLKLTLVWVPGHRGV